MQVKELRQGLQTLQVTLSAWESKAARVKDFERLLELLAGYDEMSVAEFCRRAESALANADGSRRVSKTSGQAPKESVVSNYVEKLTSADLDRMKLIAILSEIKADKKVRVIDMKAIANSLSGSDEAFRTKNAAMKTIEGWAHRKLDTERRIKGTSGIF